VLFAISATPIMALVAAGLIGVVAVVLIYFRSKRLGSAPAPADLQGINAAKLENYQLILDTLDRSNVILWWARVTRKGSSYQWEFRTPPQLHDNPIYRLAALVKEGGLWRDEQAPDHERTKLTAAKALDEGATRYRQEFRIIGPDAMHWLSEDVVVRPAAPNEWNLAGVITDVTQGHEAGESLLMLSSVVEQTADSVLITNSEGIIEYVNHAFEAMTGYSREEAAGKTPRILKSGHHDAGFYENLWSTIISGRVFQGILVNRRKNGDIFHSEKTITPIKDGSGKIIRFVSTEKDITERVNFEAKLREQAALLDTATDAIIVRDLTHRISYWNKAAEQLYGWSAKEVLGRSALEFSYQEYSEFESSQREMLKQGEWTGELLQRAKDHKEFTVLSRWTLVRDERGQPKAVFVINTNVTEKKQLEGQLFHAQRLESIGQLASGIAHDLNNILTPVVMVMPLLREEIAKPETLQLVDLLEASVNRGVNIVKQILTFSRSIQGGMGSVPLRPLLKEVGQVIKETFPKSITLTVNVPEDLWMVEGDATQLHQVLINLCVNARDAMPAGGALAMEAENVILDGFYATKTPGARAGPYVVCLVEDNGMGIPEEVVNHIFDPFFTTKGPGKGTGLGLSTVFGIVKKHGGFIRVESKVGKGSQFRVYLPAKPEQLSAAEQVAAEAPPARLRRNHPRSG